MSSSSDWCEGDRKGGTVVSKKIFVYIHKETGQLIGASENMRDAAPGNVCIPVLCEYVKDPPKPIKVTGWAVVEAKSGRIVYQGFVKSYVQEWCADLSKSKGSEYVVVELTGTLPVGCQQG